MRTLLHMPLDPPSRTARLILAEKGLAVRLVETPPWQENPILTAANPARTVPVLIDEPPTGGEIAVSPAEAIAEYLEEAYRSEPLMPATSAGRAETRRIAWWFATKFEREVNAAIARQRIDARLKGRLRYDRETYEAGLGAMRWHLDYLNWLLEHRSWLAGEKMTIADLAGAAHLSVNDYVGAVPWADFPQVKEWYARLKCRPSFRPLLVDRVESLTPPSHYADLDF
ncbi:MAG: glutathione S-transferase family protein [Amphiplicatus sp.]